MRFVQMYACDVCRETSEDEQYMLRHEKHCLESKRREDEEVARRVASGQLTIQQILEKCKALEAHGDLPVRVIDEATALYHDWAVLGTHSYRGYYAELSIDPYSEDQKRPGFTLSRFTEEMKSSVGRTYSGWKGGDYCMHTDTFVWISEVGVSGGLMVKDLRLSDGGTEIWLVGRKDCES